MLKKKQYCGFNGLHFPTVPRAPRSARVRGVHNRKLEDNQICAIEVLASLAGKLLQEGEGSSSSSNASEGSEPAFSVGAIKSERGDVKTPNSECFERRSYGESVFVPDCTSPDSDKKCLVKEFHPVESDSILDHSSPMIKSANSGKVSDDFKSGICDSLVGFESSSGKVDGGHGEFPDSCESSGGYIGNEFSIQGKASDPKGRVSNAYNPSGTKDPVDLCLKLCASVNSDHDVKLTTYGQPAPTSFTSRHNNIVNLGVRDDDEKISRFDNPNTKKKGFRPSTRIGDRRIRKLLTSRYWKVAPKLKDCELSKIDGGMKLIHRKRKNCCRHERHQHDSLFKRRKFFDRSIVVSSGFCSESVSNSHEKGMGIEKRGSAALFHGENGFSLGQKGAIHSKDSSVKFSIKSFKIPELLIEVPETATIASLKKAVLKAVTDILGDGLHVGLHLHGKKVRDDNKTLLQTGISSTENLDALGFALEPSPLQALSPVCAEGSPVPLACDTSQHVTGSPATTNLDSIVSESLPDPPLLTKLANNIDSNHDFVASPTNTTERNLLDSKALVIVPTPDAEPLAIAPVTQKPKRSEVVQRRTRRPFSVAEVEALVRAVEELGTGRWRDVKLRSFENADHRTYVDLKDKWKTLVHTAKIAPQQRRGEPVPQELLDRVLAAHAYWSQHQVKQHGKNQAAIMKIAESSGDRNGVVEAINM